MNGIIDTVTIACPGGGSIALSKHSDQDVSFVDSNGIRQGGASVALVSLFDTIKSGGSGKAPVISRVDA